MFVVDASVALAWCFEDEASLYADQILGQLEAGNAWAPSIWPLEIANALRVAEKRKRLNAAEIPRLRQLLGALPVAVEPVDVESALGEVLELARALDLTSYDAAYVALALRRQAPLATADAALREAARKAGVSLAT